MLPKYASKMCFENVLPKRASKMCFQNVLPKRASKMCFQNGFQMCFQNVLPKRLPKCASKTCFQNMFPKRASKIDCSQVQRIHTRFIRHPPLPGETDRPRAALDLGTHTPCAARPPDGRGGGRPVSAIARGNPIDPAGGGTQRFPPLPPASAIAREHRFKALALRTHSKPHSCTTSNSFELSQA